jgi:hypothetical protein
MRASSIGHLTGVRLLQGILSQSICLTGIQILALTAKLTQTVPTALRSLRSKRCGVISNYWLLPDSKFIWCEDFAGVLRDGSLVRQTGLEKNSPASSRLNIRYAKVSMSKAQRTPAPLLFRIPVHYLPRVCIFTGLPLVL